MILTAHQPVYLPWLGLFHKIAICDAYVFLNTVKYLKQDWNNRNKIKGAGGAMWLTVPVATGGSDNVLLQDVLISNEHNWRLKHWRSIKTCYGRAPYFGKYAPFFEDVYHRNWERLSELNRHMLLWFLETLGIKVHFLRASELSLRGAKSDLVLDMCRYHSGQHLHLRRSGPGLRRRCRIFSRRTSRSNSRTTGIPNIRSCTESSFRIFRSLTCYLTAARRVWKSY